MQKAKHSFYDQEELEKLPFKYIGRNVLISRKASFYNMEEIYIGDFVRIDDFCILSGKINLGNYIHISAQSALYGAMGIEMEDFSGLSPACRIFSMTDDFSGEYMVGPLIPENLTNVTGGKVRIGKYVQVGTGSVILPAVTLGEGVAVGSMSLVNKSLDPWGIYAGIPAKYIKERSKRIIELAKSI